MASSAPVGRRILVGLGLRLLRGADRRGRIRFLLLTGGTAAGVVCLLIALMFPQVLSAREERARARVPFNARGSDHKGVFAPFEQHLGGGPFDGFLIAGRRAGLALPPGVDTLPGVGEAYVSPSLEELVSDGTATLPGGDVEVVGTIAPEGLTGPDERFAWIGVDAGDIAAPRRFSDFGVEYQVEVDLAEGDLKFLALVFLTLAGAPLLVFFGVCARLSASSRDRRLAALRLMGLSARQTALVNAVEAVTAALIGTVAGFAMFGLIAALLRQTRPAGLDWFAGDAVPSVGLGVLVLVLVPASAALVSRVGAGPAIRRSLSVRRYGPSSSPVWWRGLPLGLGAGILIGLAVVTFRRPPGAGFSDGLQLALVVGMLLTGVGLVMGLPPLAVAVASSVAPRVERLWLTLGLRRVEQDPGSPVRVVAGLVVVLFVAGFAIGTIRDAKAASAENGSVAIIAFPTVDIAAIPPRSIWELAPEGAVLVHLTSTAEDPVPGEPLGPENLGVDVVFGTCDELGFFLQSDVGACRDGTAYRIESSDGATPRIEPGSEIVLEGVAGGSSGSEWTIRIPEPAIRVDSTGAIAASILEPREALATVPRGGDVLVAVPNDEAAIGSMIERVRSLSPTVQISYLTSNPDQVRHAAMFERLLYIALILGITVGFAAFIVAAIDNAVERRPHIVSLAVVGVPRSTLRAAQASALLLLLVLGLTLALTAGKLAEQLTAASGGYDASWSWFGVLIGAGVGALFTILAVGVVALAVPSGIEPSLIRRE